MSGVWASRLSALDLAVAAQTNESTNASVMARNSKRTGVLPKQSKRKPVSVSVTPPPRIVVTAE